MNKQDKKMIKEFGELFCFIDDTGVDLSDQDFEEFIELKDDIEPIEIESFLLKHTARAREEERKKIQITKIIEPPSSGFGKLDKRQIFIAGQMNVLVRLDIGQTKEQE